MKLNIVAAVVSFVSVSAFAAKVELKPANDDCKSVIVPLVKALSESAMSRAEKVTVELIGETEEREYQVLVVGKPYAVGGGKFFTPANSWNIILSNDSNSKCLVYSVGENG